MKLVIGVFSLLATAVIPLTVHADEVVRYGVINGNLYSIPDSAKPGVDFVSNPENPSEIVITKNSKIKLVSAAKTVSLVTRSRVERVSSR